MNDKSEGETPPTRSPRTIRRVTLEREGEPVGSLGPDRQIISLEDVGPFEGTADILAEDGKTTIGQRTRLKIVPDRVYRITPGP